MNLQRCTLFLFLFFFHSALFAQSDDRIAAIGMKWGEIEKIQLPDLDNDALMAAEQSRRAPGVAPKFAENIAVDISPVSSGTWAYSADQAIWRLVIESKNAKSLNLGFTRYHMPEGGTLVIYNKDHSEIVGPFAAQDNESHNQLWTPIIYDDELLIEVVVPIDKKDDLALHLGVVNHDFMGIGQVVSGSCNLDVVCGLADGWEIVEGYRDIIRSVAGYSLGGSIFCTGFLINNQLNDGKAYFMTADHCGIGTANAPSLVVFWNFENSTCRAPGSADSGADGDGSTDLFNTGSTFRAAFGPSDFALVELDDPIPAEAEGFLAGYSLEIEPSVDTTICIHHPSGDEKRISFEFDDTYLGTWDQGDTPVPTGDHIVVPDWDIGTTEPGSSGSPLFDKNKRVIGQLHGGQAACGNDLFDTYGWFSASWVGGGTPATRLSNWLDPNNTGVTTVNGLDLALNVSVNPSISSICVPSEATFDIGISPNFENPVMLTLNPMPPAGVVATFSQNPAAPGESVTLSFTNTQAFGNGEHTFSIEATDGTQSTQSPIKITTESIAPAATNLSIPANQLIDGATNMNFEWEVQPDAELYDFQIATDANFTNIVVTLNDLSETSTLVSGELEILTDYFWRVRGINICGVGEWTSAFTFRTASVLCSNNVYEGDPAIIENVSGSTAMLTKEVSITGFINEVKINNLNIGHSFVGDIIATLIAPSGTSITLFDRLGFSGSGAGCASSDLMLSFSDNAAATAEDLEGTCDPGPAAMGEFQPLEPLAIFNGENPNGTWIIEVLDDASFDGGAIIGFDIEICTLLPNTTEIIPTIEALQLCQNATDTISLYVGSAFENEVTLIAQGIPGSVNLTYAQNPVTPGSFIEVIIETGNAPSGVYNLMWEGNDGVNTGNGSISLEIIAKPNTFLLSSPSDGAIDQPQLTNFAWEASDGASSYLIEIFEQGTSNVIASETVSDPMATVTLNIGESYDWTVTSINECGNTEAINTWSFNVIGDLSFSSNTSNITSCVDAEIDFSLTVGEGYFAPAMIAYSISGNPSVTVEFDQDETMVQPGDIVTGTIIFDDTNNSGNYPILFTIEDSDHISNTQLIVEIETPVGVFELLTPLDASEVFTTQPSLDWGTSLGANEYVLQVATDADFSNVIVNKNQEATIYHFSSDLETETTYYWRVLSANSCGEYQTEVFSFTVGTSAVLELDGMEIQFVPNPFKNFIDIQLLNGVEASGQFDWNLFSAEGKRINSGQLSNGSTIIDTELLPAGIYFIQVYNQGHQVTERVVKF